MMKRFVSGIRPSHFGIVHSGCGRGFKASGAVFEDQALGRLNVHPVGGFEKHIRERLSSFDLVGRDYDGEKAFESDRFQSPGNYGKDASRGH
jgi:hypothetical protein